MTGLVGQCAQLAAIGAIEAVVYLLRYRSAHSPSHWWSATTTLLIAWTRVAFVLLGAKVVFDGGLAQAAPAGVAYGLSAAGTTAALHWWLERRRASS